MISEKERAVLEEVQRLPLTPTPFADIAERLGESEELVIDTCRALMERGIIRRFGPSISHRKAGLGANPMTVLKVPEDRIAEIGKMIAEYPEVTHCYERSGWDYNLFFMVHGKTREEAEAKVHEITKDLNIDDYRLLYSTREFKKISFELPKTTGGEGA